MSEVEPGQAVPTLEEVVTFSARMVGNLCDRHAGQVRVTSFGDFQEKVAQAGCQFCLLEQVASLKEQLRMCRADLDLRTRERDQSWRNIDELKSLIHANYEARAVLSSLSSWVGNGLGEDTTSAADYEARIRDGVDRMVRMETAWKAEQARELDMLLSYAQAAASRLREAMKGGFAPEDPYVVLVDAETRLIAARAGIVNVWERKG